MKVIPYFAQPHGKFGHVLCTPAAADALERNESKGLEYLIRHSEADWGEMCNEDKRANWDALRTGARLFSSYVLSDGTRLFVFTDAVDAHGVRQTTTISLPLDYEEQIR